MPRRRLALFLLACVIAAAGPVPEPPGYWLGPTHGTLPDSITGGRVIHTDALAALLRHGPVILLDVSTAPIQPPNLPSGAIWLPVVHKDIPGSVWLPDVGRGVIAPGLDAFFRRRLDALSGHDRNAAIVIYCHQRCWMSWNAAKRAIGYGYRNVYWYPDGVEAWTGQRHPVAAAQAEQPDAGACVRPVGHRADCAGAIGTVH